MVILFLSGHLICLLQQSSASAINLALEESRENETPVYYSWQTPASQPIYLNGTILLGSSPWCFSLFSPLCSSIDSPPPFTVSWKVRVQWATWWLDGWSLGIMTTHTCGEQHAGPKTKLFTFINLLLTQAAALTSSLLQNRNDELMTSPRCAHLRSGRARIWTQPSKSLCILGFKMLWCLMMQSLSRVNIIYHDSYLVSSKSSRII